MRDNAALVLLFVGLVFPGPVMLTAQIQPGGRFFLNVQGGIQVASQPPTTPANAEPFEPPTGDLLEFVDGSLMHGELKRMDTASGLRWNNPAAKMPIDLQPAHINSIRFAHADSISLAPTSHLRFVNGDDLFGSVSSLDEDHLVFSTWFGGALTIQRASVQTVTMLSSNYNILYEGPGDTNGWIIGNHNPESWTLLDGTFISGAPGSLGRDFKLSGSSTIEFDLAWNDIFELLVNIYSDAVDHMDMGNSYVLEFTRDQVNVRRADAGRQFPFRTFGSAPLTNTAGKSKVRITIQSNKEEGTVAVYIDNVLAKRWKDENGFSATGGGILFQQTGLTGATLKLSSFKISQWEGRYEPETSAVATNADVVRFINHDQAAGKITGINGGKVTLALGETLLQIPLQRVTQINFAAAPASLAAAPRGPWEVRAHFPRGGSLSFQLEKWDDKEVAGRSAIFGSLAFLPGQIRQLEFNLDHPKTVAPPMSDKEFEGLDE
jgi:hypothetical protein